MAKSRTRAQRRAKEIHNMARRTRREERLATAMLLGGHYIRSAGVIVIARENEPTVYIEHINFTEITEKHAQYRMQYSFDWGNQ